MTVLITIIKRDRRPDLDFFGDALWLNLRIDWVVMQIKFPLAEHCFHHVQVENVGFCYRNVNTWRLLEDLKSFYFSVNSQ